MEGLRNKYEKKKSEPQEKLVLTFDASNGTWKNVRGD
jgi:hypothetical protein